MYNCIFFLFMFISSLIFSQSSKSLIDSYIDSAREITNKYKDFEKGLFYINKAIELDSNQTRLYETKLRFQMSSKRFDSALQTGYKLISLTKNKALYTSIVGLLLENKGDSIAAFKKYRNADTMYRVWLDTLKTTETLYEFVLINRAMNLLFMREDSMARKICVEYYEQYKKIKQPDWLNRIINLDRDYYLNLILGIRKESQYLN